MPSKETSAKIATLLAAALCALSLTPAVAQDQTVSMETVSETYTAGDLKAARAGLLGLANAGEAVAQYRLGYMMALAEGGPFDREGAIKWIESALAQDYYAGHTLLARVYLSGDPEAPHYMRAAELLQLRVGEGDAEAAMHLGGLYRQGRGVEGDKEKAFELLHAAAKANIPAAQFAVSQMYSRGEGVAQDDAQASRWLLSAAESGYGAARLSLYYNYSRGTGFPKDDAKALDWLIAAAQVGNTMAERILGTSLLMGEGVQANPEQGIALLIRAGEKGEAGAQSNLGYAYASGTGVEKDLGQAALWYQRAADQGLTRAALVLGDMYQSGQGVEKDINAAVKYYRTAFYGKSPIASARLGTLILDGALDPASDPERAFEWIAAAAETGNEAGRQWLRLKSPEEPYAHYRLGRIYADGLGTDVDPAQAAHHFRRAAERGLRPAQAALSEIYATGAGVELDYIEAHKWANIAAANGDDAAAARRDVMAQLMTPDQIAQAQDRARAYLKDN